MSVHARVAPSKLSLTVACNGSLILQEQVQPCPRTEEQLEGDAGHLVAAAHAGGTSHIWKEGFKFEMPASGPRQWNVTAEMTEGAKLWVWAMGGYNTYLRVEDGVSCEEIHDECFGTPDGWRFFPAGAYVPSLDTFNPGAHIPVLRLGDYKFGHRYIDEFECWQLIAYARGVLKLLNLHDQDVLLEFIIVQPRCWSAEPVRVWRVMASQIRHLVNIAFNAAHAALGPNPTTTTGPHCMDCEARHLCETLRHGSTRIVEFSGIATPATVNVDPLSLGQELAILEDAMKQLEARQTGLKAQADAIMRAGANVPNYELSPMRTNRQWNDDVTPEAAHAAMQMMGINIAKAFAVMTPTQTIEAGIDESIVEEYSHRPRPKLAVKRVKGNAARKLFLGAHTNETTAPK